MAKRRSTIDQQSGRTDTFKVLNDKVKRIFGHNISLVKYFHVRQEDADMPAAAGSFPRTVFMQQKYKIVGVFSHASVGTWNANLTIDGVNAGDAFTNSNSSDPADPLIFSSEVIYEENDFITVKMNSGDVTVEQWEAIFMMLALQQA